MVACNAGGSASAAPAGRATELSKYWCVVVDNYLQPVKQPINVINGAIINFVLLVLYFYMQSQYI